VEGRLVGTESEFGDLAGELGESVEIVGLALGALVGLSEGALLGSIGGVGVELGTAIEVIE
jgi:hypothetical protein